MAIFRCLREINCGKIARKLMSSKYYLTSSVSSTGHSIVLVISGALSFCFVYITRAGFCIFIHLMINYKNKRKVPAPLSFR